MPRLGRKNGEAVRRGLVAHRERIAKVLERELALALGGTQELDCGVLGHHEAAAR